MPYLFKIFIVICLLGPFNSYGQTPKNKALIIAETHFNAQNWEASQKSFLDVLKNEPHNGLALERLGDLAFQKKEWQKATEYFEKALNTDTNRSDFHYKYAGSLATLAKHHKFKALFVLDDAMEHFLIAEKLDPESIAIKMALVEMYDQLPRFLGGNQKKATEYVQKIYVLDQKSGEKAQELIRGSSSL